MSAIDSRFGSERRAWRIGDVLVRVSLPSLVERLSTLGCGTKGDDRVLRFLLIGVVAALISSGLYFIALGLMALLQLP